MSLGELEQQVLNKLWQVNQALSVRDVYEALSTERKIAYTTVLTVLSRLAKKGIVSKEPYQRAFRYRPTYSKAELTAQTMVQALEETDSSARGAALQHFVGQLSPEEAQVIKSLFSPQPEL